MKLVLIMALALLLVACATTSPRTAQHNLRESHGENGPPAPGLGGRTNELVGKWRYADAAQSCNYVFKKDGTFNGDVTVQKRLISQFTGKWSVEGDNLLYEYIDDAMGSIPPGSKDRDKLLEIAQDHFVIEAADGNQRRYVRIQ